MGASDTRRVLVTGATGLIGVRLVRALRDEGYAPQCLSRDVARAAQRLPEGAEAVAWNGRTPPRGALAGTAAVVHLAGEPVFAGRLTARRRAAIRDSRIVSTRQLVQSMGELPAAERPGAFLCASAVGYYGSRGDEILDEASPPGTGFLAEVCVDWEAEAARATAAGVRTCSLRIGIVLAREGGALPKMALPVRLGLGGPLGDGRQWVPWIHVDDLVALMLTVVRDARADGVVNAVAPEPVRNLELTRAIARVLRRPALLRAPAFAVRAALGELAEELLGSRRVLPKRASELGFRFRHPTLETALAAELAGS
ncbi:MAG: TIGR01777 family oxidoreductase [Deltaproteobacteria bacterium]|nr:MAG: TIGR01777 family oxidoreductase [Deltaproteobacteria bacterium]